MSGDYTRFTFDPLKRYSGVRMQQGRVQLDSDWNEEIDILRRRLRTTTLDIMGPLGVPYAVSPNAFSIGWIAFCLEPQAEDCRVPTLAPQKLALTQASWDLVVRVNRKDGRCWPHQFSGGNAPIVL